jgi:uncharacterized protein YnzC (UPF0291/DUF896 family)
LYLQEEIKTPTEHCDYTLSIFDETHYIQYNLKGYNEECTVGFVMVSDLEIKRINELARKSKTAGLSDEEKEEQAVLRRKYIDSVKNSLRTRLEHIEIVEDDE